MARSRWYRCFLTTTALACACGPLAPAPADSSSSSSGTAPAPEPTSDADAGSGLTSGEPSPASTSTTTSGTTTGVDSTGPEPSTTRSTSDDLDPSTTGADTGDSSTSGGTTGHDPAPCGPFCEPTRETCPPGAQVNTNVAGATPIGAFAATFAAQSLPKIFGDFYMLLVPAYSDGALCEQMPQLRLTLPSPCWEAESELEVPAELLDGQVVVAATTASLHNYACTWWGFLCEACEGHVAFDLEVVGDGWSLGGSVDAGCCRTFHDNNTP